jgi:hypothetical protein
MTRNHFEELDALRRAFPDLTFNNDGYENIPDDVRKANADGQAQIETILKETVEGFVRFQNFKPRPDGTFAVRCQREWSPHFIGVSYIPLSNFLPGHTSWTIQAAPTTLEADHGNS